MLTGPLLRARVVKGALQPGYVDPSRSALREIARDLLEAYRKGAAERWSRARVHAEIEPLLSATREHKLYRGLAKVLEDHSEFQKPTELDAAALRKHVFLLAQRMGPLALEPGLLGRPTAQDVLERLSPEVGLSPGEIQGALYADRRDAECLASCKVTDVDWLLNRYNVALVQAILLRALQVRIILQAPSAARLRQLFRHVKFHQLCHRATPEGTSLQVVLDGPLSLFRQSTRYGMQLANFFPALLLQTGAWRLEAQVAWGRHKQRKGLHVSSHDGLRSHYADHGAWRSREQVWFEERFQALQSGWALEEGRTPINLGGRALLLPDFTFRQDGRVAHLEILGFWRKDAVAKRLSLLERYGPGNVVVAISRKLAGEQAPTKLPSAIIPFAQVIPAKQVLHAIQQVARSP